MRKFKLKGSGLIDPTIATDYFNRALYSGMEYDRTKELNDLQALQNAFKLQNYPNEAYSYLLNQENQDITNQRNLINNQTGLEADTAWNQGVLGSNIASFPNLISSINKAEQAGDIQSANEFRNQLTNRLLETRDLNTSQQQLDTTNSNIFRANQAQQKDEYNKKQNLENQKELLNYKEQLKNNQNINDNLVNLRNNFDKKPFYKLRDEGTDAKELFTNNNYFGVPGETDLMYKKLGNDTIELVQLSPDSSSYRSLIINNKDFDNLFKKNIDNKNNNDFSDFLNKKSGITFKDLF